MHQMNWNNNWSRLCVDKSSELEKKVVNVNLIGR